MYVCTTDVCDLNIIHITYPCFTEKAANQFNGVLVFTNI